MMIRRTRAVLLTACALAVPADAAAQQQAFGPSADVSVGVFAGGGGYFAVRGGPAAEGVLAVPLAQTRAGTVVAGVTAGISGVVQGGDLECINDRRTGGCVPDYPTFASAGAVAGVQRAIGSSVSARVLAGPAYFQDPDGGDAYGLQGRLDVAKRLVFRTAIVGFVRGSLLPRYQGETLSYATFGLGIRIQ